MIDLNKVSKAFTKIAEAANIEGVSLHSLRHSLATWALRNGASIRAVQAILSHSSATTTLGTYGHLLAGAKEQTVSLVGHLLASAQARKAAGENGRR